MEFYMRKVIDMRALGKRKLARCSPYTIKIGGGFHGHVSGE
jgi:hypothetical protein